MKEKHIVYSVINGYVQLFLNHNLCASGYVFDTDPEIPNSLVGVISVYENQNMTEGELNFFYLVKGDIDSSLFGRMVQSHQLKGKTGFPVAKPPLAEMGNVQKEVVRYVLEGSCFKGSLVFSDRRRVVIIKNKITLCSLEEVQP